MGVREKVFKILLADSKNDYRMIDSTIVRAHQQAVCGKEGTKTRLWGVPEEGLSPRFMPNTMPWETPWMDFHLTKGQAHDLEGSDVFLEDFEAEALLADKAFDADDRVLK